MSQPFSFTLTKTDGAARRGEIVTPHGAVQTPAFMPVGTQAHGEGADARDVARNRRRDRARQHLSSDAAAGRRAHRRARRAAHVHAMAAADPDRFRRLPGDVAVGVAQARRGRRDLPLASRRRHGGAHARARDRNPGAARRRYCDAARRMPAAAGRARGDRARHAIVAALGGAQQARLREQSARGLCLVRHRAGRRRRGVARRERPRTHGQSISTVTPSAGWRWASRRR